MNKVISNKDELVNELNKLTSKSSKIRYLKSKGLKVSQICKLIHYDDGREIRPQHVYNVLKTPLMNK